MAKYHINSNGEPGECSAQSGNCPFGGESNHYANEALARAAFELSMGAETFRTVGKSSLTKGFNSHLPAAKKKFAEWLDPFDDNPYEAWQKKIIEGAAIEKETTDSIIVSSPKLPAGDREWSEDFQDSLADSALTQLVDHLSEEEKLPLERGLIEQMPSSETHHRVRFSTNNVPAVEAEQASLKKEAKTLDIAAKNNQTKASNAFQNSTSPVFDEYDAQANHSYREKGAGLTAKAEAQKAVAAVLQEGRSNAHAAEKLLLLGRETAANLPTNKDPKTDSYQAVQIRLNEIGEALKKVAPKDPATKKFLKENVRPVQWYYQDNA